MQLFLFFGLLFAFLVAVFAVQNADPVDIEFLFWWVKDVSLSLVVLGSVFAGALIALVLGFARQFRMARRIKELTAKLAGYEMGSKGTPRPEKQHKPAAAGEARPGPEPGGDAPAEKEAGPGIRE
ncbi:LapA family protein [Candidatus Desulforudis audaxviator]|uniref:Lipopolysaccharide assembly protein A domain-containing protein n=1 Tax=Desulforudis audaxviator (strain MP104C) TaxID=477974 RepID=B1I275_DESAP|nr:LapA family protein [Candidatus Desulforudis audaxviator]ACA59102.1 hypothetical protein Daud_0561 [Candidatus Desulforudis audaxviator MP104C]AZK59156.1 hypothetical protein Daudx_0601 [Candidatus Desulforudis audaxviator]